MKVLHVAETIKGGVATIVRELMHAQTTQFGETNVLALIPDAHMAELNRISPPQLRTFRRTGRNVPSFLQFALAFAKLLLQFRPDVVHIHSTFAGFLARPILVLLWPIVRPKVIYSPHAWSFLMDVSPTRKRLFALIEILFALPTHAIICGSEYERQQGIAYGLPARKLHLILSGVSVPVLKPGKAPATLKPAHLNLLFVGRFDKQKGFDILQATMKNLQNHPIHLTAVGEAVRDSEKPVPTKNISYTGWLKPEELATYFAHADVLIMPSRWESFGLVAAEAAAYGLPVIASRSCSLPEVIKDTETGLLFTPESVEELTEILTETPAKIWQSMRPVAKTHYENNLTAGRMTSLTTKLYQSLRG